MTFQTSKDTILLSGTTGSGNTIYTRTLVHFRETQKNFEQFRFWTCIPRYEISSLNSCWRMSHKKSGNHMNICSLLYNQKNFQEFRFWTWAALDIKFHPRSTFTSGFTGNTFITGSERTSVRRSQSSRPTLLIEIVISLIVNNVTILEVLRSLLFWNFFYLYHQSFLHDDNLLICYLTWPFYITWFSIIT